MTDQNKAPERIWASYRKQPEQLYAYPWKGWEGNHRETEYVRADLHDALAKGRDELQAEVERLRVAARMARARTTDSAVAYALDAALQRKEGDE